MLNCINTFIYIFGPGVEKNIHSRWVVHDCYALTGPENRQSECHLAANISNISVDVHMKWERSTFFKTSTGAHQTYPCIMYRLVTNGLNSGTLVILCTRVLLCTVVVCCCLLLGVLVCCCVLLCVRGVRRSPCSCVVWAGIQGEGAGWQGSLSPSHYSVGIHGCLLVGGGVL